MQPLDPESSFPSAPPPGAAAPLDRRWLGRYPGLWWATFLIWSGVLFWLSSISGEKLPVLVPLPQFDKVEHAGFFAFGFGLFAVALGLTQARNFHRRRRSVVGWTILAATLGGLLDEFHQTFTPHRSGLDLGDWTADVVGGTLGALVAVRFLELLLPPQKIAVAPPGGVHVVPNSTPGSGER